MIYWPAGDVSESLRHAGLRSVLCVPLTVMGIRIGVLYLSTTNPRTPFDEQHLEMLVAVAGIGALALEHSRYVDWLEAENQQLLHEVNLQHGMVGENPGMKKVYESISLIAPTDAPALVLGESGTGKELAARAIHNNSNRRNGPFVACELWRGRWIRFFRASSLAMFVAPLPAQIVITRALSKRLTAERCFSMSLAICRFIARPRCCEFSMREKCSASGRREKFPSMFGWYLRQIGHCLRRSEKGIFDRISTSGWACRSYCRHFGIASTTFRCWCPSFFKSSRARLNGNSGSTHPETIRALQEYSWPGNVRELGRAIRWAVVFGKSSRLRPEDLPPEILRRNDNTPASVPKLEDALQSHEKQIIRRALEETKGNVVEAAKLLDRAPNYLQRRISQLDLRPELERIRGGERVEKDPLTPVAPTRILPGAMGLL
jgi:hypothetical protein